MDCRLVPKPALRQPLRPTPPTPLGQCGGLGGDSSPREGNCPELMERDSASPLTAPMPVFSKLPISPGSRLACLKECQSPWFLPGSHKRQLL